MNRFRTLFLRFAAAVFLMTVCLPVLATPVLTPPRPETKPSPVLPIAEQLGQQIQTLVSGPPAAGNESDENNAEPAPTFGTRALNLVITAAELVQAQAGIFITNFAALPQLSSWYDQQIHDPNLQGRWISIGNDLLYVVGLSFLGALALDLLLYPVRRNLRNRNPATVSKRFQILATLFVLRALPIILFIAASATLLDQIETHRFPRFIILNVVYALALSRIVFGLLRGALAPDRAGMRLVPLPTEQAAYAYRWLRAFSLIVICGYFVGDVARAAHAPPAAIAVFANILGLLLVLMTVIVIAQKRAFVAVLLRGNLSSAHSHPSWIESLRLWLARWWHVLAIAYLFIGYAIAALDVANGFALILRGTLLTLMIFAGMGWLFGVIHRWGADDTVPGAAMHHTILRFLMRVVLWMLALIGIAAAWWADIPALFATSIGQRVLGSVFSISVTIIALTLIYEVCSARINVHLNRRDEASNAPQASARARTLLPMIRNALFITFAVIVAFVVLSECGFNIGPLLAGAGVVGVAVGFGSQTLVKDFLTGLFIVVENTIAIGDVVTIGTHSGVVEAMSVRTIRLRDQDGALHILPFSEVTQIVNMTRDFAYAVISIGVSYDTDLERAMGVIRAVGEELQRDPVYKRVILEPVEISGVDKLGDFSITLLSRLRTRPGKQWDVKRMFLLKLKQRFDKEGIVMPYPTVMQVQKNVAG